MCKNKHIKNRSDKMLDNVNKLSFDYISLFKMFVNVKTISANTSF